MWIKLLRGPGDIRIPELLMQCASAHTWPTLIISLKLLLLPWQIWTMWLLPNVTTRLLLSSTYENITHFNQSLLFIKLMNYEWNIVKSDENSKKHFWTVSTNKSWKCPCEIKTNTPIWQVFVKKCCFYQSLLKLSTFLKLTYFEIQKLGFRILIVLLVTW